MPCRSVITDDIEGAGGGDQQLGHTPMSVPSTVLRKRHSRDEVNALNVKSELMMLNDAEVASKIHHLSEFNH